MNAELALTALATLLACVCVAWTARSTSLRAGIIAVIALAACLSAWLWSVPARKSPAGAGDPEANRPLQIQKDGYVSSDSCRSCHPSEYDSWHASYHRTMTTLASPETIKGEFHGQPIVLDGKTYIPGQTGDQYWIEMDDPFAPEDELNPNRVRKDIAMITGSHHMQVYWFPSGKSRILEQSPIVYWIDQQRWLPRSSSFLSPPENKEPYVPGEWNQNCSRCHATHAQPEVATPNEMYTTVGQFGIACEACHKPGEEHARLNRNPVRRFQNHLTDAADPSVVNPAEMETATSSHACAQCHSLWIESAHRLREWMISGDSFRPGEDLTRFRSFMSLADTNQVASLSSRMPEYQQQWFWPDGVLRVTGREYTGMMESPCHKNASGKERMTCFSCHVMHPEHATADQRSAWRRDQLKHDPSSDRDCLQCHPGIDKDPTAHTHHLPESGGSRCVNCHQPHTTYGLMTAIRSHQVTSPEVHPSPGSRPNACNQCHLDKPLSWTAAHLEQWYGSAAPELSESLRTTAASVVWMLQGDAVQRAISAWTLGWNSARDASGSDWQPPFLIQLMDDPYATVRWMAWNSLRSINADYTTLEFDFTAPQDERRDKIRQALEIWSREQDIAAEARPALLLKADHTLERDRFEALLKLRDNTPITLQE